MYAPVATRKELRDSNEDTRETYEWSREANLSAFQDEEEPGVDLSYLRAVADQKRRWADPCLWVCLFAALGALVISSGLFLTTGRGTTAQGLQTSSSTPDFSAIDDLSSNSNMEEDPGVPTVGPTNRPTRAPVTWSVVITAPPDTQAPVETESPTATPRGTTVRATDAPTTELPPTQEPTVEPTLQPTIMTSSPTESPTLKPTWAPTASPSESEVVAEPTYIPGKLTVSKEGLLLSEGLDARRIAITNQYVPLAGGGWSQNTFHARPDAGATFPDTNPDNPGGWIYVSNSEVKSGAGGVGALTFDVNGNVIDYQLLLTGTSMNCGGGRTPWSTWVSCEEVEFTGQVYQVDPKGVREPQLMTLGRNGGRWESFAYDIRNKEKPHFFLTEDHRKGAMNRFAPNAPNWDDPWSIVHGDGRTDYLMLFPDATMRSGTYMWTNDREAARENARSWYPDTEGVDVYGNQLFFVCKKIQMLFILDLDGDSYQAQRTSNGLFDGTPDQMQRVLGDSKDLLYFTEEGGINAGIHARDHLGRFYTVFESPEYIDETTGLSFSPDGRFMYTAYQENGYLFQIWRTDGLPFQSSHLDVKFHHQPA